MYLFLSAADGEQSYMAKYMFVIQVKTKSGRMKKKGGDKLDIIVDGPEVYTTTRAHNIQIVPITILIRRAKGIA